jgi:hypothetical protein
MITISIQIRMNGKTSKKTERSYFVIPVFNQLYVMLRKIMAMIKIIAFQFIMNH